MLNVQLDPYTFPGTRALLLMNHSGIVVGATLFTISGASDAILALHARPSSVVEEAPLQTKLAAKSGPFGVLKKTCWMDSCAGRDSLTRSSV
jgi:hypothetical protein